MRGIKGIGNLSNEKGWHIAGAGVAILILYYIYNSCQEDILIAGVNGAGKSTLFHLLDNLQDMPRINSDEIVREFGNWKNSSDELQ